jgi:hypothetical protein
MSNDDFQHAATFLLDRMSSQQTNAPEREEDGTTAACSAAYL